MARLWSVGGLLLVACFFAEHALAVVLAVDQPFKPQAAQVRTDLAAGEKYSEISQDERAKVSAALDRLDAVFEAQPNAQALRPGSWRRFATIRSSSPEF